MKILYLAFLIVGAVAQGPRDLEPRVFAQESPGITVPAGTVIPVSLMRPVSSRHAREGDGVYARTIFPLAAGGQVVVPIGTYVQGRIVRAVRPGKVSGRAEITINFHTMVWESGMTLPIYGSLGAVGGGTQERRGEAGIAAEPTRGQDVEVVGRRAATGAGIGAIAGRSLSNVLIGAGAGAGVGVAEVLLTRGEDLVLPSGTVIDIVLDRTLKL